MVGAGPCVNHDGGGFAAYGIFPLLLGGLIALATVLAFGQETGGDYGLPNFSLLEKERQLRGELEKKIQTDILDPILGRGKAVVFVSLELDVVTVRQKAAQSGSGVASKGQTQSPLLSETEYILPGIPKPKSTDTGPLEGKSQQARQEREALQEKAAQRTVVKRFEAVIMHDETLAADVLDMVRQRIIDALKQFEVKPDQISFKPTRMEGHLVDDFRQPMVYIPSLFALLVFLFLMFLFGPLASFMRGYVRLLERREGTEVNVESEFKNPEDEGPGGPGGGAMGALEGEMASLEKEGEGGEEEMQKFEPFRYVNEENIKGLIYLLKREEPWIISVVLTYLKPELAQKVLTSLPVDLQARVAMETAVIREVTREQVVAIDQEIKERVDFVIGGIEPLVNMLEEAKPDVRESILEYLRNEKPEVYEKLRKRLLLFEDLPLLPDKVVAMAVRELKPSEIAVALKEASPEIENKIFANLSSGAVNLVKEELELSAETSLEEVERERQKILAVIKRMETEGKVAFREKPQATIIDGIEEDEVKAQERMRAWRAPAGEGAAQPGEPPPYERGLALYNEGRYEEAIGAFQAAVGERQDFWEAYQALGGAYYALGRLSEALWAYEQVLALNPSPEVEEFVRSMRVQAGT